MYPFAIRFKKRRRFVSYHHQLLETLNDVVHCTQVLFFQRDFMKSK